MRRGIGTGQLSEKHNEERDRSGGLVLLFQILPK